MRLHIRWLLAALMATLQAPCATAQTPELDRQREYARQQEEQRQQQQRWAEERTREQDKRVEDDRRRQQEMRDDVDAHTKRRQEQSAPSAQSARSGGDYGDYKAARAKWLGMPPLPAERNGLLGSWRLEGGGAGAGLGQTMRRAQSYDGSGGAGAGLGEVLGMLANMNPEKMFCEASFGRGIAFTPSTFSSGGVAGLVGGSVAYRSRGKQVVAIPGDSRANIMPFEIASPNRIVSVLGGCTLVRVGAPAANAAPAPPRSTLARPSREVCVNTLVDKLGSVGINQVRAMANARFNEAAIEGKVPNTNHLRIDLRNSACDDTRVKATLYDFDASGMLQSVTLVWERPPGPAPAPIFNERIAGLSRFHTLPPPQSPSRLQADTSFGRLILEDRPERNLLLEAYKTPK